MKLKLLKVADVMVSKKHRKLYMFAKRNLERMKGFPPGHPVKETLAALLEFTGERLSDESS